MSVALLASGCGASGSADSTAGTGDSTVLPSDTAVTATSGEATGDLIDGLPDPCTWLTPGDLEAVVGTAFDAGATNTDLSTDFQNICEWSAADGSFLFVQVLVTDGGATVSTQRQTAEEFLGKSSDVSVAGASDAYAVADGSILGMAVGDRFVQVSLLSSSLEDVTDRTVALAEIVASNA
jgi:hypothetical protein